MINDDIARKVEEKYKKFAVLYLVHFGNKHPETVTCEDCSDFKSGLCSGGASDVFECMYDKAEKCEVQIYNWN